MLSKWIQYHADNGEVHFDLYNAQGLFSESGDKWRDHRHVLTLSLQLR